MPRVNDIHSRLNPTDVAAIARPGSVAELSAAIRAATGRDRAIALCGGRHAMGGQQFAAGGELIDLGGLDAVHAFDPEAGIIEVGAGIQWPALIDWLGRHQDPDRPAWGIVQKQTGADRLSLGGALSANIHGRGLRFRPIIQDVESFTLVDADGAVHTCSRTSEADRFRLAIGGYGLFGAIASVRLRLARRRKLERRVAVVVVDDLMAAFVANLADGCVYGDFQFMTAEESPDFLRAGILSCYAPVDDARPVSQGHVELDEADWRRLYHLAHTDRQRLYEVYSAFYRSTHGQVYWSDLHQLGVYLDGYHDEIDRALGATVPGSEMITEVYVPRPALAAFFAAVREDFRRHQVALIYGTVRLVERDDESALPWARRDWACIVFNLCVRHDAAGVARAADDFRRLIDHALAFGGSFFLTYHRWATRRQLEAAHPGLVEALRAKTRLDPRHRFQSDWWRHHQALFADALA